MIKKNKSDWLFLESIITQQPLPKETVFFSLRSEFVRVVKAILDHIESKGEQTDAGWVQSLLLTYALRYGSIRGKEEIKSIPPGENKLLALDGMDIAVWYEGHAYALSLDQIGEMLAWLAKNPAYVKTVLAWI